MPRLYRAKQGDCLSSIAAQFRFKSYRTIYDHPKNADLKQKRGNPNHIYPGDILYIPDLETKQQDCPTDRLHVFVLSKSRVKLRVKLLDQDRRPYKHRKYRIQIQSTIEIWSGYTSEKGLVEAMIPADATAGKLQLWLTDESDALASLEMPLKIGHLDPHDEVTGVQARLNHLGFDCGAVDGILGPKTTSALSRFQKKYALDETGGMDGPTCDKLFELHDKE